MKLFITTLLLAFSMQTFAAGEIRENDENYSASEKRTFADLSDSKLSYEIRLGVNIGGTMPLGMPETIRGLNSYKPRFNPQIAGYVNIPLKYGVGLQTGLRVERKAMISDARVDTYKMAMVREGNEIAGVFTGNVHTEVNLWSITVPVYATYDLSHYFRLRFGPYISFMLSRHFSGYAYKGHMRLGDPTGEKVDVGEDETSRGTYDFSEDMRHVLYGVDLGIDWYMGKTVGLFADFQWGLDGIFKGSFHTISQTMYPLYGTIGIFKVL